MRSFLFDSPGREKVAVVFQRGLKVFDPDEEQQQVQTVRPPQMVLEFTALGGGASKAERK